MIYRDLRDFIAQLEQRQQLKRIEWEISPHLEMTEIADRVLRAGGPALLFNRPRLKDGQISKTPVLSNLFGKVERIAWAMGQDDISKLREIGKTLALLKEPEPPQGFRDFYDKFPLLKQIYNMLPKQVSNACCQEIIYSGEQVDLTSLPIQHCWPGDIAPLLTWGLTVTRGPQKKRQNLGIYRQQLLNKNQLIMRWLAHRGGALDYRAHCQQFPHDPFPLSVVIGCDPATILAAVTPIPDSLSEYQFAGLLRGSKSELVKCLTNDLQVPASAEIILEGEIRPGEIALEGPYGDHTGYYNEQAKFPVFTVLKMTTRYQPIYHSTYTGKPPDEPSVLGVALNEVFIPLLQKQFPEIVDFYLPPEGCSYRLAVVSINKQFPGHARRIMMGIWGFLRQFMYTKFIIVTDEDINIRSWHEVIWAITTRVDAARDISIIDNTPIDYLDFASPKAGLGSKMGIDATNKWHGETNREWGTAIHMDSAVKQYIDSIWSQLKIDI